MVFPYIGVGSPVLLLLVVADTVLAPTSPFPCHTSPCVRSASHIRENLISEKLQSLSYACVSQQCSIGRDVCGGTGRWCTRLI